METAFSLVFFYSRMYARTYLTYTIFLMYGFFFRFCYAVTQALHCTYIFFFVKCRLKYTTFLYNTHKHIWDIEIGRKLKFCTKKKFVLRVCFFSPAFSFSHKKCICCMRMYVRKKDNYPITKYLTQMISFLVFFLPPFMYIEYLERWDVCLYTTCNYIYTYVTVLFFILSVFLVYWACVYVCVVKLHIRLKYYSQRAINDSSMIKQIVYDKPIKFIALSKKAKQKIMLDRLCTGPIVLEN